MTSQRATVLRHLVAQVVLDEGQGQVDPGGDPALVQYLPSGCRSDRHRPGGRGTDGQGVGAGPVGGYPSPVEQSGLGGEEGPGAHRGHPPAGGATWPIHDSRAVSPARRPCPITSGGAGGCRSVRRDGQGHGAQADPAVGPHRLPVGRRQGERDSRGNDRVTPPTRVAPANTSNGPTASRGCTPGETRR